MGEDPIKDSQKLRRRVTKPRPGHADLNGALKYNHRDMRNILERSSARETAARVAAGAIAKILLKQLGIQGVGYVKQIYNVTSEDQPNMTIDEKIKISNECRGRTLDQSSEKSMMEAIDQATADGNSIGGIVVVSVEGGPAGIGSHVYDDRRLDGKRAGSVMSINAFKGG